MEPTPSDSLWTVQVMCSFGLKIKTFSLPASSSVREVRQKFKADLDPPETIILKTRDGKRLCDSQNLLELEENPGSQKVTLFKAEKIIVCIRVLKTPDQIISSISPVTMPADLHAIVRHRFNLPPTELFRLCTEGSPLKYHMDLDSQGIRTGTVLFVDFANAQDYLMSSFTEFILDAINPRKLVLGGMPIRSASEIFDSLTSKVPGYLNQKCIAIQTETSMVNAASQCPPLTPLKPFRVFNNFGVGIEVEGGEGHVFDVNLRLKHNPSLNDLFDAIADKMKVRRQDIRFRRFVGKSRFGVELYEVCDDNSESANDSTYFSDINGCKISEVRRQRGVELLTSMDSNERTFPIVFGARNRICAIQDSVGKFKPGSSGATYLVTGDEG